MYVLQTSLWILMHSLPVGSTVWGWKWRRILCLCTAPGVHTYFSLMCVFACFILSCSNTWVSPFFVAAEDRKIEIDVHRGWRRRQWCRATTSHWCCWHDQWASIIFFTKEPELISHLQICLCGRHTHTHTHWWCVFIFCTDRMCLLECLLYSDVKWGCWSCDIF